MTRTTRREYWSGYGWSGTIEVLVGLPPDGTDAWREALGVLARYEAIVLAHGVVYRAATGYYCATDEAVLDLGRRLLAGESYDDWCLDFPSTEHETLKDAIGVP